MKMTVCLPCMGQLGFLKGNIDLMARNTSHDAEFLFIDNDSSNDLEVFLKRFFKRHEYRYIPNGGNIGLIPTMQQAYELCRTEVLAVFHNDVYIYESLWDKRVMNYFNRKPEIGMAGLFGAEEIHPDAGRGGCWSNLLEAEIHGARLLVPYRKVAIFDAFSLIFRREMLETAGGFDQRYHYHHIFDKAISLTSLALGYQNIVVNAPCHHSSGITSCSPQYQSWINQKIGVEHADTWTHDENHKIFKKIWGPVLPLKVLPSGDFERDGIYQGNAIVGYDWRKAVV